MGNYSKQISFILLALTAIRISIYAGPILAGEAQPDKALFVYSKNDELINRILQNELEGKNNYRLGNQVIEFLKASADSNTNAIKALYLLKENSHYDVATKGQIDNFILKKIQSTPTTFNEPLASAVEEMISLTERKNLTQGLNRDWINFLINRVKANQITQSTVESLLEIRRRRTVYNNPVFRERLWDFLKSQMNKSDQFTQYINNISKSKIFHVEVLAESSILVDAAKIPSDTTKLVGKVDVPHIKQAIIDRTISGNYYVKLIEKKLEGLSQGKEPHLVNIMNSSFSKLEGVGPKISESTSLVEKINMVESFYNQPITNYKRTHSEYIKRISQLIDIKERLRMFDVMLMSQDFDLVNNLEQIYKKVSRSNLSEQMVIAKKIEKTMESIILDGAGLVKLPTGEIIPSILKANPLNSKRIVENINTPFVRNSIKRLVDQYRLREDAMQTLVKVITKKPTYSTQLFIEELANTSKIKSNKNCLSQIAQFIIDR